MQEKIAALVEIYLTRGALEKTALSPGLLQRASRAAAGRARSLSSLAQSTVGSEAAPLSAAARNTAGKLGLRSGKNSTSVAANVRRRQSQLFSSAASGKKVPASSAFRGQSARQTAFTEAEHGLRKAPSWLGK